MAEVWGSETVKQNQENSLNPEFLCFGGENTLL